MAPRPRASGDLVRALLLAGFCLLAAATIPSAGDYAGEVGPAMSALLAGDLHGFAAQAPVYGASAWPRAPFAAVAQALGGGELALYRAGALACLLAAGALVWWLERAMRRSGRPAADRLAVAAVILVAPIVLRTLRDGHPEDVLASVLAVAAVLGAARGRPLAAGLALGLAVTTKPWAVLAGIPVLLATPGVRAAAAAAAGAAVAAAVSYLPILLLGHGRAGHDFTNVTSSGDLFHPQQLLWPLRETHDLGGGVTAFTAPDWAASLAHPAIVLAGAALALLWGMRRRATGARPDDALLVLAACLMLRCVLDPWNLAYYAVPAVLALAAWEALSRDGLPVLSILLLVLTWVSFSLLPRHLGWDGLAAAYLAWAVPFTAALAPLRRLLAERPQAQPASSATAARTSPSAT